MAAESSAACLQTESSSEADSLLPHGTTTFISSCRCRLGYRARGVKSKGAVLVLVWSLLIPACYASVNVEAIRVLTSIEHFSFYIVEGVVSAVLYVLTGWLADVYFGRYKVMKVSILVMWLGSVGGTLLLLIYLVCPHDALKYVSLIVAYTCVAIGSPGLIVNAVPFGTDQMLGASSEEISAFIHWFVWAMYTGRASNYFMINSLQCTGIGGEQTSLVSFLFAVAVSSIALCFDFLCQNWLVIEPVSQNPLKSIYSVLKYAATHKYPARRSALTYWEEDIPSRIDLGKSKYGGPFTTEQVEDVKTFFRLLLMTVAISFFVYPLDLYESSLSIFASHFQHLRNSKHCYSTLIEFSTSPYVVLILGIPLYELVLYPLARNWIPSTLKRAGIGAFVTVIVASAALSVDMAGHAYTNATVDCMFVVNGTSSSVLSINYLWIGIPIGIIGGTQILTLFISLLEFICAQTPYTMKGLVIGLSFASALGLSSTLSSIILTTWAHAWSQPVTQPTCAFWFYLFLILVTVVGLGIFCIVAKWYKKRERNELLHQQRFVEDFYDKYIH